MTGKQPRAIQARVTGQLVADMKTLAKAGLSQSDMVKHGVNLLADAYRQAWATGVVPEGQIPIIDGYYMTRSAPHSG